MRVIMEIVCAVVITNFITGQIAWHLGKKNERKWQEYLKQADTKIQTVRKRVQ